MQPDERDIAGRLAALSTDVRLVFFTQTFGCDACLPARQMVDEVARLSERVTVEEYNLVLDKEQVAEYAVDRAPAIVVVGTDDLGLRYYGVPSGYELMTLVDAVVLAGGGSPDGGRLSPETLSVVASLDRPVDIKVFVTPSCRYCPQTAGLAYRLAAASPHITTSVIEATEFPDLVQRYRVSGVPKTVVDDQIEILGVQSEEIFVKEVFPASPPGASA